MAWSIFSGFAVTRLGTTGLLAVSSRLLAQVFLLWLLARLPLLFLACDGFCFFAFNALGFILDPLFSFHDITFARHLQGSGAGVHFTGGTVVAPQMRSRRRFFFHARAESPIFCPGEEWAWRGVVFSGVLAGDVASL